MWQIVAAIKVGVYIFWSFPVNICLLGNAVSKKTSCPPYTGYLAFDLSPKWEANLQSSRSKIVPTYLAKTLNLDPS